MTELSADGSVTHVYLHGSATVVRLPLLASELEEVPANTEVHVHLDHLDYIDHACLDLLANWEKQHELTGGKMYVDWEGLQARFRRAGVPAAA